MEATLTSGRTHIRTPKVAWPSDERLYENFRAQGLSEHDAKLKVEKTNAEHAKIGNVAREFESNFIATLLKEMKKNSQRSELFHGGFGEEVFDSMLSQEQARVMAFSGEGIGLASMIEQSMTMKLAGPRPMTERFDNDGAIREIDEAPEMEGDRPIDAPTGTLDKVRNAMALSGMNKVYR